MAHRLSTMRHWQPTGSDSAPSTTPTSSPPAKYANTFFSPRISHLRAIYFKIVGSYTILTILIVWCCLTFYWGSLWKQPENAHNLRVFVINRDTATSPIASAVFAAVETSNAGPDPHLGWHVIDEDVYPTDEILERELVDHAAWGAVVVQSGAAAALETARQNGDASYEPQSAVTFYYVQARNELAAGNYLVPQFTSVIGGALARLSQESAASYLTSQASNSTAMSLLAQAPQTITPGYSYTFRNLRPYTASVVTALALVGGIYTLVLSFIQTMAHDAARGIISPYLTTRAYLTIRIVTPLCVYGIISFFFAMINLPFKVPFDGGPFTYAGGFFVWWIFLWAGMGALGLATEFAVTILTAKFVSFFLVALIVVNVSEASIPIELSGNPIYRIGYGLPLLNLNEAVRCLVFNTKNTLGRNFGVLIAWVVLSCFTISLTTWLFRRNELRRVHADEHRDGSSHQGSGEEEKV